MNLITALVYLAAGLGLLVFFRLSNKFSQSLKKRLKFHKIILSVLPSAELLAWIIYVFWVIKAAFGEWEGYSILVVVFIAIIIIVFSWYFIRDLIAGVILKAENSFVLNQYIKTPDIKGTIKKVGYRTIELESESGQFSKVPYSRLSGQIFSIKAPAETMMGHELIIGVSSSYKFEEIKEQITRELLLLPWISVKSRPVIQITNESNETITLKISYQTSNESHASAVNQYIRKRFEGK